MDASISIALVSLYYWDVWMFNT